MIFWPRQLILIVMVSVGWSNFPAGLVGVQARLVSCDNPSILELQARILDLGAAHIWSRMAVNCFGGGLGYGSVLGAMRGINWKR
ncbi:hypothetical protein OH492_15940 [Vibrio chagasii]|nr:hypothetical protein [Vibrio chagasii]